MRRFGRVVVDDRTAGSWSYQARSEGSDIANLAGNCERPVIVQAVGLRDKLLSGLSDISGGAPVIRRIMDGQPVWIDPNDMSKGRVRYADIYVPCRKCAACLKRRAWHWRLRAESELRLASRSWFSTFTLRPDHHARNEYLSIQHMERRGHRWEAMSRDERFAAISQPILRQFQLYLKRLRKGGAKLRYLVVVERHMGGGEVHGMPHLHALIHEQGVPVTHRKLTDQWSELGFTTHKLVDDTYKAAAYACKYLTKDIANKPRASQRYGRLEEAAGLKIGD